MPGESALAIERRFRRRVGVPMSASDSNNWNLLSGLRKYFCTIPLIGDWHLISCIANSSCHSKVPGMFSKHWRKGSQRATPTSLHQPWGASRRAQQQLSMLMQSTFSVSCTEGTCTYVVIYSLSTHTQLWKLALKEVQHLKNTTGFFFLTWWYFFFLDFLKKSSGNISNKPGIEEETLVLHLSVYCSLTWNVFREAVAKFYQVKHLIKKMKDKWDAFDEWELYQRKAMLSWT